MSDYGFPEKEALDALKHAGPLADAALRALAKELGLELTNPTHFQRTMQYATTHFVLDTLRKACLPANDLDDLVRYLKANPDQHPALFRRELAHLPRFRENVAEPAIRRHLLDDGPTPIDPASMVVWVDWMRAEIAVIGLAKDRRRGRPPINVPLYMFIANLARIARAFGQKVTRPTHADVPEANLFFRFVDKALAFGCLATEQALEQVDTIPDTFRVKVRNDLERLRAMDDRGLSDAVGKGLARP